MYKYNLLSDSKIIDSFKQKFIDDEKYKNFTIQASGYNVHLFDFIINPTFLSYSDVIKFIEHSDNYKFYIMLDLSQCYKDNEFHSAYKIAEAFKQDLLAMLEDQKNDMCGERLLYVNDIERATYWDMIIFDERMEWCLAITHEDKEDGDRLCFFSTLDFC